jgi:DNA-binding MarR family transcriptional regulator
LTVNDRTDSVRAVTDEPFRLEDLVLPVLLGMGRQVYGAAIRDRLAEAGITDMPRTGARVIGGLARDGGYARDIASGAGVSKQAVSQLVDTLVLRGYVERVPDEEDRRRVVIRLTDRGQAAADEIRAAVESVDAALLAEVGAEGVERTRATLAALVRIGHPC